MVLKLNSVMVKMFEDASNIVANTILRALRMSLWARNVLPPTLIVTSPKFVRHWLLSGEIVAVVKSYAKLSLVAITLTDISIVTFLNGSLLGMIH